MKKIFKFGVALLASLLIAAPLTSCTGTTPTPAPSSVDVTEVVCGETEVSVKVGETHKLNCSVLPENASNKTLTYISSNPEVAEVSNSGTIVGLKKGSAIVTISSNNGKTKQVVVLVSDSQPTDIKVTSISLNVSSVTLDIGGTKQITATVSPSNATDKSLIYSSNASGVATVSETGLITAVAAGDAVIKVTSVSNPTVTKTVSVHVNEADPFADIIEWKYDVTLKVPNGQTWVRKYKFVGGETYYMRRHSGSDSCYLSVQYPDDTYLEGYNRYYVKYTMITSWTFCIAKTSWVKITVSNDNTMSGSTSLYWYDY